MQPKDGVFSVIRPRKLKRTGPVFIVVVTRTTSCQNPQSARGPGKEFGRTNDYLHSPSMFWLFSQMMPSHRNDSPVILFSSLRAIPLDRLRLANLSLQHSTLPTSSNRKLAPALHQHNTLTPLERFIPSQNCLKERD